MAWPEPIDLMVLISVCVALNLDLLIATIVGWFCPISLMPPHFLINTWHFMHLEWRNNVCGRALILLSHVNTGTFLHTAVVLTILGTRQSPVQTDV